MMQRFKLGKVLGGQTVMMRGMGGYQMTPGNIKGPLGMWPFPIANALTKGKSGGGVLGLGLLN
ncbi:MAG: hypothetical protein ACRD6W_08690, partial [Nitrososphaerales archaeon]